MEAGRRLGMLAVLEAELRPVADWTDTKGLACLLQLRLDWRPGLELQGPELVRQVLELQGPELVRQVLVRQVLV